MRCSVSPVALAVAAALAVPLYAPAAMAQQAPQTQGQGQTADGAFDLGRIIVIGRRPEALGIGANTLSSEAIQIFNRNSLDTAVDLVPGVIAQPSGNRRNETDVFVRGFSSWRAPLSIDGVRVYLPADNRLDYSRFLTQDVAEIQISKGYASVLDGPGGMGGAINLVTRKPVREYEVEGRATLNLDSDADYAGETLFGLVGTNQGSWYAQASFAHHYRSHWDLSSDFTPTAIEDGGARDLSRTSDWRLNLKAGFTPNATDEYSLSYTRQEGSKNAPLHVSDPVNIQRYWSWPFWNIDSVYFLSTTALGERATLKTRVFRNTFENLLSSWDDPSQTAQTRPYAFNSYYEDESWGGSAQLDFAVAPNSVLSVAGHYRRDDHIEYQQAFPAGTTEPPHGNREDTYSLAVESRTTLSPELTLTLGVSYDWRDLSIADEYGVPPGGGAPAIFSYPLSNADAWNGQARLDWAADEDISLYGFVSSRTRFPTIWERFSSRFGGAVSNPDLESERATNFEIGGVRRFGAATFEAAVFYSIIDDWIVNFPFIYDDCSTTPCTPVAVSQSRNLGSGETYGFELSAEAQLAPGLSVGGNYTFLEQDLEDPNDPNLRPRGVPRHSGFLYAQWTPVPRVSVTPSLDFASDRWTVDTAGTTYYQTGEHVLVNLGVDYDLTDRIGLGAGARNLFDANYALSDGFPQQGRSFYVTLRARY